MLVNVIWQEESQLPACDCSCGLEVGELKNLLLDVI